MSSPPRGISLHVININAVKRISFASSNLNFENITPACRKFDLDYLDTTHCELLKHTFSNRESRFFKVSHLRSSGL